jgi:hypothetical protein
MYIYYVHVFIYKYSIDLLKLKWFLSYKNARQMQQRRSLGKITLGPSWKGLSAKYSFSISFRAILVKQWARKAVEKHEIHKDLFSMSLTISSLGQEWFDRSRYSCCKICNTNYEIIPCVEFTFSVFERLWSVCFEKINLLDTNFSNFDIF